MINAHLLIMDILIAWNVSAIRMDLAVRFAAYLASAGV